MRSGVQERLEVIVRFLAVLELFKQGIVDLDQFENFGVLEIRRIADDELDAASVADWDAPVEPAAGPGTP